MTDAVSAIFYTFQSGEMINDENFGNTLYSAAIIVFSSDMDILKEERIQGTHINFKSLTSRIPNLLRSNGI